MSVTGDFNQQVIDEFRANGGRVGGMFEGASMVILHTTGAKSGREIVSPLVYFGDGDGDGDAILIVASAGGSDRHPAWYHNLVATPDVTVEVGAETYPARAVVLAAEERDRVFADIVARSPGFGEYQTKTSRVIPIIRLVRA